MSQQESGRDTAKLLAEIYACAGQQDWGGVAARVTDDFVLYEPQGVPFAGEYRGKDGFARAAAAVFGTWESFSTQTIEFIGGEDCAAHYLLFTMTSKKTGNSFSQTVCEVGKFEGDLLKELRIHYFDIAEVAREAG